MLHWNSVISTEDTRYMCLGLSLFYLLAALEYYKYMKIPLALFPTWIIEQYNLNKHAKNGMVHIEMRRAVWGLPQAGIQQTKNFGVNLNHMVTSNVRIHPVCGITSPNQFCSH